MADAGVGTPIAIVGMGCRLPGGVASPARLWRLTAEGREATGPVPPDRWDGSRLAGYQNPEDRHRYERGCFIDQDIWSWDPEALFIAPWEEDWVDPQYRVLMEVTREAIEHSGIPLDRLRGTRTGVYVGTYPSDFALREAQPVEEPANSPYQFGASPATMVGRMAFSLDVRGPVTAISTMCSSSLYTTTSACMELASGNCDIALTGGVFLMVSAETHHHEASLLFSASGHCSPFDARADGYVHGEGAGMLVLKRLEDAARDGDRILAVIRGSATNSAGQVSRMTAPSVTAQIDVFERALARAGVDPGTVGYVETHGPGTPVGDPVEYASLDAVYGTGAGRCAIGSVKTNIGHSEPAAGAAGTIKAVQCLRHGMIPPNLNFSSWNPAIDVNDASRLFVPTELTEWPVPGEPRRASVCSYGITGTNAHIVLEQAPPPPRRRPAPRTAETTPRLFALSSASDRGLRLAAGQLADWLDDDGAATPLADVAHTLGARRAHIAKRLGIVARSRSQLAERAREFAGFGAADGAAAATADLSPEQSRPVFVFSGQGSQWPGMGRDLLDVDPAFTAAIDELDPLIADECGISVRTAIATAQRLDSVAQIQPVLFAVQVALARMWESWGVRPAAVIGQSMAEVSAAVVAGALNLSDGAEAICRRAELLREVENGAMASVMLPASRVCADIALSGADRVWIAVLSSPESTVVSGDVDQVAELIDVWEAADVTVRRVTSDVASHSPLVDPVLERLRASLASLRPTEPTATFYSTATEDPRDPGLPDAGYWAQNLRETVRFVPAVQAALRDGHRLFVECSPHPLAVRGIAETARHERAAGVVVVGSLRRDADAHDALLGNVAAVHCAGLRLDWEGRTADGELAEAPGTAWVRTRHGGGRPRYRLVRSALVAADEHPLLGGHVHDPERRGRHLWQTVIGPDRLPWLADHAVVGVPVMAGAAIAEMMLSAGARCFGTDRVQLRDLELASALLLDPEPTVTTRLEVGDDGGARVEVLSTTDAGPLVHARARVEQLAGGAPPPLDPLAGSAPEWQREEVVPDDLYRRFRERHNVYHGPAFNGLDRIQLHGEEAIAALRTTDEARVSAWMMALHPALTDQLMHALCSVWIARYAMRARGRWL